MTPPRTATLPQRALGKLHTVLWPESRAALRTPFMLDPPSPREFAQFGRNTWIVPPARITGAEHISIGAGVAIMEHVNIAAAAPLHIGDESWFARFCTIWATVGIHIGSGVMTSDYVTVVDCWRPPDGTRLDIPAPEPRPVTIEDGAYLGCSCFIGPGVTIGKGAFIGEGSIVLEDVPAHVVVYGNPARVTKSWSAEDGWQGDMFGRTA